MVHLHPVDLEESVVFHLDSVGEKVDATGQPLPSWALYPAGVAWVFQERGFNLSGFRAAYSSNIPNGAGLSSSAAIEVAFAVLWNTLGDWEADKMTLAKYCLEAETRYVGLSCGLMDQFASLHGTEGHALYFDTRTLDYKPVSLPDKVAIVIANSGVRRSLADSAYNDRYNACREAVQILKPLIPGITALRDVSLAEFARGILCFCLKWCACEQNMLWKNVKGWKEHCRAWRQVTWKNLAA